MNNEPVAWMHKPSGALFNQIIACIEPDDLIPLYTALQDKLAEPNKKVLFEMDANAYAQQLDEWDDGLDYGLHREAATMLRQQQAEIESMKERMIVAEKELNHMRSFFGCDPAYYGMTSSEPVAWMNPKSLECGLCWQGVDWEDIGCIPLYTHPVKELTDDELIEDLTHFVEKLHRRWGDDLWIDATDLMSIEKAIELLRKAQEK
jgi:hypothetical protein